ncbi:hypothetical protein XIS1_490019 [Xenorhabdus innexi]|uniref:Uncharacterized protein n=1 Tax=Xenorhabdus innexi TaxID=290109 RepID=A0A1N6MYY7_9GAMM|nr:hypothetical protein XIS1_490019 [Xenorhabdus innexi]
MGPGSVKIKNNVRMGLISNKTEEYFKNFNLRYNEDTIRGVGIYLMVLEGKSYYYNMHVRFVTRSSGYLDRLIFGSKI